MSRTTRASLFERLLAPFDPEEFVASHWDGHRVLHVPGEPGKFDDIYSARDLDRLLASARSHGTEMSIMAFAALTDQKENPLYRALDGDDSKPRKRRPGVEVPAQHIDEWLAAGSTLYMRFLGKSDPKVAALEEQLRAELSYVTSVTTDAFLSSAGSGLDVFHIDPDPTITIQLYGEKTWRVSERPAVIWPKSNAMVPPEGGRPLYHRRQDAIAPWEELGPFDAESLETVVMRPGDLLFVPAGCWHGVRSHPGLGAVSLSISPQPFDGDGGIPDEARRDLEQDVAWRHPPLTWPPYSGPGIPPKNKAFFQHRARALLHWLESH